MNFALCTKCIHFAIASQSRALFKRNVIIHIRSHMLYSRLFAYPLMVNNFRTPLVPRAITSIRSYRRSFKGVFGK